MAVAFGNYKLKACDVLYREHRTVKERLAQLEADLLPVRKDHDFVAGVGRVVDVLERELPPHFAKEEEALFPVMETVTGRGFPPVEVMKAEHQFLIDHFASVREAALRLEARPGTADAMSDAARHLIPLLSTLDEHIIKEDQVLLVMASEELGASHDAKILRVFDEIDREGRRWA